ncbi:endonuclease Q family protein [Candidatus Woesearchaeota archaeon]|nr:endonuclease Q family protein [Candidatus Woesearchaeota archaeon]
MQIFADLHIHSRFSRATSKDITIQQLEKWAKIKGIDLLGTGDFTHPLWLKELKENLTEDGSGFLKTKSGFTFALQTEISLIYSQANKGRRIHLVVLAPSFSIVDQINDWLSKKGRLDYDGRPIFNISCPEFVEKLKAISKDVEIIPAHAWTPWFGVFGSKTGFDSLEECFQDQTKHISAIETGLSSDPPMNWRLSKLDRINLVSFSDAHSFWPWRLGREATIFDIQPTYKELINAIRTGNGLIGTIEVDPSYGKYHFDGHRACNVRLAPKESTKIKNICPVCKKPLTIGVLHRVEELADRPEQFIPENAKKFFRIIPLSELIAHYNKTAINRKSTWDTYFKFIRAFGTELNALLKASFEALCQVTGKENEELASIIVKNREGKIPIQPGFDGVYGYPVFDQKKSKEKENLSLITTAKTEQKDLKEFFG